MSEVFLDLIIDAVLREKSDDDDVSDEDAEYEHKPYG